jgi:hypothetical protein
MGKPLPTPYPGQSMEEYREQLVNFQKNYWSFLKPSKGGSKFIPLPPEHLNPNNKQNKTKKMSSKKLSEHVEQELFDKEKRVIPSVDPKKVIKTTPKIVKESVLGVTEDKPVKKKRPYYRKKYNKPTPVEVVITEPVDNHLFLKGLFTGLGIAVLITIIINILT